MDGNSNRTHLWGSFLGGVAPHFEPAPVLERTSPGMAESGVSILPIVFIPAILGFVLPAWLGLFLGGALHLRIHR